MSAKGTPPALELGLQQHISVYLK